METLIFTYLLKASISIIIFYGLYMLLLRNDTLLKIRRFYFLFVIAFSILFPFFNFDISPQSVGQITSYLLLNVNIEPNNAQVIVNETETNYQSYISILLISTLAISTILLGKFGFQVCSLFKLKRKNRYEYIPDYQIIKISDKNNSSFSFFKWIFINVNNDNKIIDKIIAHEKAHARQMHSVDVIISELMCIIFWWNPFAWLLKREIKTNLEYLADQSVLNEGFDSRQYQYSLLQEGNNNAGIPLINNFNVSQLKKRISMMNKQKTSILVSLKYLLAVPLTAGLLLTNCRQSNPSSEQLSTTDETPHEQVITHEDLKETESGVKPFTTVEKMPEFPGGEKALMEFISTNLKYPTTAEKAGIEGRVIIRFTVGADGAISNVIILRGIDPACDNEAVKVIESMPKWTPGKQSGSEVPVYFTLPIVFRLNK